jgi:hypothetical protein
MHISQTKSDLLSQPSEAVAEISIQDFSRLLRSSFDIASEVVPNKPYAVRYTGPPYIQSNEDCKSILVYAHAKGTRISPLCIFAVLEKFQIPVPAYLDAVLGQGKMPRMKPPVEDQVQPKAPAQ